MSDEARRPRAAEYERILGACPVVLYTLEISGGDIVPTWVSGNFTRLFGHNPDDFVGNALWWPTYLHPDDREAALEGERKLLTDGHVVLEYRFRRPDGTYMWIRDDMNLVTEPVSGRAEAVGSMLDVTPRRMAQEAALDSEGQAQAIIENMSDTFYRADTEGRVVMASRSAIALLGYSIEELIGRKIAGFYVDPDGRAAFLRIFNESGGDVTNYEAAMRHKNGGVLNCIASRL
jgi:PAS domain S-box-containing protein